MNTATAPDWTDANQRYLTGRLEQVRLWLEQTLASGEKGPQPISPPFEEIQPPPDMQPPPALDKLASLFALSPFECSLLLLCAGVELDARFAGLIASLRGDPQRAAPTFSLALAVLPGAHWDALSPSAPLRYWRLIELGSSSVLTQAPLCIDERILHYLTGVTHLDERLTGYISPFPEPEGEMAPSQQAIADQIVAAWSHRAWEMAPPVVQLAGGDLAAHKTIAAAVSARINLKLYRMAVSALPNNSVELESLQRLWEREAILGRNALLLDCGQEENREAALTSWIEAQHTPLFVSCRDRLDTRQPAISFEVSKPSMSEQRDLWHLALGEAIDGLNGRLDGIVSQFNLDTAVIRRVAVEVLQQAPDSPETLGAALWQACKEQSRPGMKELAQPIRPLATWDDLVLPEAQLQTLREISIHVRQRLKVYEAWGFAARSERGLGISALFSGVSGTGKTMAAEVLANELRLDLYRIDLSQVVSKYIGETEKNLRRVFDAAEAGGAVLLFDEADALFGKRSEVRDSHDRYANVEISYLLQRMEAYRGLAILTTNLQENVDPAFLRRLRFVVHFPFPDAGQRAEIWRRIFPVQTPTEGLDFHRLARLNIPGGNIRNIAIYAAFLAAEAGEAVGMSHLQRAARVEFAKLERPLSETELGGRA